MQQKYRKPWEKSWTDLLPSACGFEQQISSRVKKKLLLSSNPVNNYILLIITWKETEEDLINDSISVYAKEIPNYNGILDIYLISNLYSSLRQNNTYMLYEILRNLEMLSFYTLLLISVYTQLTCILTQYLNFSSNAECYDRICTCTHMYIWTCIHKYLNDIQQTWTCFSNNQSPPPKKNY